MRIIYWSSGVCATGLRSATFRPDGDESFRNGTARGGPPYADRCPAPDRRRLAFRYESSASLLHCSMGRGMPPPFDWTRCKPGWLLRPPIRRTTQPTWSSRRTGLIEPGMAFPRPLRVFPYDFSVFLLQGMVLERPGRHTAGNGRGGGRAEERRDGQVG